MWREPSCTCSRTRLGTCWTNQSLEFGRRRIRRPCKTRSEIHINPDLIHAWFLNKIQAPALIITNPPRKTNPVNDLFTTSNLEPFKSVYFLNRIPLKTGHGSALSWELNINIYSYSEIFVRNFFPMDTDFISRNFLHPWKLAPIGSETLPGTLKSSRRMRRRKTTTWRRRARKGTRHWWCTSSPSGSKCLGVAVVQESVSATKLPWFVSWSSSSKKTKYNEKKRRWHGQN